MLHPRQKESPSRKYSLKEVMTMQTEQNWSQPLMLTDNKQSCLFLGYRGNRITYFGEGFQVLYFRLFFCCSVSDGIETEREKKPREKTGKTNGK
jgi:hypothetical protein